MWVRRIMGDKIISSWMVTTLVGLLILPLIIGAALLFKAYPLFRIQDATHLILTTEWSPTEGSFGFLPFIISSVYVTILSFIFAAPICIFAGIYLTQYASKRFIAFMYPVIDILAGLPSVIFGVWGVLIIVPLVGKFIAPCVGIQSQGYSILAAGLVLAAMCIPYMLNMLIEMFRSVPVGMKEASLSLGATEWESVKHVVVKKSIPGIISSFGLGLAKAFGETLAVMMVVGNLVRVTLNPFDGGYPLPALIANNYGEMLSIPNYDAAIMFAAFLLLIIILLINLLFRYLIYKTSRT